MQSIHVNEPIYSIDYGVHYISATVLCLDIGHPNNFKLLTKVILLFFFSKFRDLHLKKVLS